MIATALAELPDIAAVNPAIRRVVTKPYRSQEVAAWVRGVGARLSVPTASEPGVDVS